QRARPPSEAYLGLVLVAVGRRVGGVGPARRDGGPTEFATDLLRLTSSVIRAHGGCSPDGAAALVGVPEPEVEVAGVVVGLKSRVSGA
ncbi:MAG: hypothetical protein QOI50_2034, partial [Pseudonocardiales bacterium]|nr:hypothetical protein [Pseudonocardiales bacterium]